MLLRIVAIALAGGSLALASANAQTGTTSPSTGTPSTTTPGTGSTTTPPSSTTGSGTSGSMNQAQQPMGSFDASKYKTKTECLNAATAAHASASACNNLK